MQLLAALVFAAHAAASPAPPELRGESLMNALRSGGYTILLRHARTDRSFQEAMGAIPTERSQQRNLSSDGVRDAKLMGAVLRKYGIPIGEIVASPMYRAMETAEMAAGKASPSMALRAIPSTAEQAALVAAVPKAGTNRLLVTHHFVIEKHVPGIHPGEIGESEAAIVRPLGDGKVELVGRITLNDWERLGGVAVTPASQLAYTPPAAAPAVAQAHAAPAALNTRAGRAMHQYIDVYNSGDTVRMRNYIETTLVPVPGRTVEDRLATYRQSIAARGAYIVTGVRASSEDEVSLDVKTKAGDFILTLRMQGDRVGSVTLGTFQGGHP